LKLLKPRVSDYLWNWIGIKERNQEKYYVLLKFNMVKTDQKKEIVILSKEGIFLRREIDIIQ